MPRYSEYTTRKAKGVAIARQVSTVLKKAGFVKAGRYQAFQKRDPGFIVTESGNGTSPVPTASLMWVGSHYTSSDVPAEVIAAVEADGRFVVHKIHKMVRITRRED